MSTTRSAAFMLSVLLAASLGGAGATAQDMTDAPSTAVQVTGTSSLVGQLDPGERTLDEGVVRIRGNVLITVEEATDRRVTGRATITLNIDTYQGAAGPTDGSQIRYGRMRLENEAGAWSGAFGGRLSHGGFVQTYWLHGEGAYEGLSYVVTAGGNGPVWASRGVIFPGAVPPVGGQAQPRLDRLGPGAPAAVPPVD